MIQEIAQEQKEVEKNGFTVKSKPEEIFETNETQSGTCLLYKNEENKI